jgi:hypothetical protein
MTISETLNQILMDLEGSAQWRSMKAEEYPDDKRNEQAAALLERLTSEIASAGDVALTDELARLEAQLLDLDDVSHLQNTTYECSEYRRRIGFHEFPTTGEEYLRYLVHIYSSHLSLARSDLQSSSSLPDDPYSIFMASYHHTGDILAEHGNDDGSHLMNRMVFTHQVVAMEAYLADTLANAVISDSAAMQALLAKDTDLAKEKFNLSEIAKDPELVTKRVREYLQSIRYHNLSKVEVLYRNALGIDLFDSVHDRAALHRAIIQRHDCVHRNGYDVNGQRLTVFTKGYVQSIADAVKAVVEHVETQRASRAGRAKS